MKETELYIGMLRNGINELRDEKYLSDKVGLAKALIDTVNALDRCIHPEQSELNPTGSCKNCNTQFKCFWEGCRDSRIKIELSNDDLMRLAEKMNSDPIWVRNPQSFILREDDDLDEDEPDFDTCGDCDQPDACGDFGCAIKQGLREPNQY